MTQGCIEKLLECGRGSNIVVVGDSMLDVYDFCYTAHSRPSPELPDKRVYTTRRSVKVLGGAGNVAANLAFFGVKISLVSVCGDDGNALEISRLCNSLNIHYSPISDASRPTTIKTRLYIDDTYVLRRDDELTHKVDDEMSDQIERQFTALLEQADAVIFSDYNKGFFTLENAQRMIALCHSRSIPMIVDFKPPNAGFFAGATVVAPNLKEAREIYNGFDPYCKEKSLQLLNEALRAKSVVVTIGADGILVYENGVAMHVPGRRVVAVDPCGCGDTVRACLALGLACGLSLAEAADFANYAASLVVQKLGTATLSPRELLNGVVE